MEVKDERGRKDHDKGAKIRLEDYDYGNDEDDEKVRIASRRTARKDGKHIQRKLIQRNSK